MVDVRKGLLLAPEPLKYLKGILVPRFINIKGFIETFGNPYRAKPCTPSPATIDGWLFTIAAMFDED